MNEHRKTANKEKKHAKAEEGSFNAEQGEKLNQALSDITEKMVKDGMTPQDSLGISRNVLESIYAQAYRLYNTGKYIDATHLFRMLIMMNAMEPKYQLGLAACFHMIKEYENAVQTYTLCSALDPESPVPHYHASDCFIQMKDNLSAMISLELAIKRAANKEEYSKMKERALLSLESLKKQLASFKTETP